MKHARRAAPWLAATLIAIAGAGAARAQPMMMGGGGGMPDLSTIVGRPLPDGGMPTGTVSVRVARKIPVNAVAGVEVSAVIKNAGGDLRKRTANTDGSGRVIFDGLAPGDEFHATVTVDGEKLETQTFPLPATGGVRTMLIAGLGAPAGGSAQAQGEGEAEGDSQAGGEGEGGSAPADGASSGFTLGATAAVAVPAPELAAHTLELRVLDETGAPIKNHDVSLGVVDKSNRLVVKKAQTDAAGVARYSGLATGDGVGYAAVVSWHGTRLGTAPFAMPAAGGMRAVIRALARTSDPSVMRVGDNGRVVVQMHEDNLQIIEMLPFENTSDRMFDPGPGAIEIPLPKGFVGAQPQENDRKIEVRQNHGVAVHGPFMPERALRGTSNKNAGQEVSFGFVLPYHGSTRAVAQSMPNGIGAFTLITEQIAGLGVEGPGVGVRQERELGGRKYWVMPVEGVPPGGTLMFTLTGLPSTDATDRYVAGGLALALVLSAFVFGRRPARPGSAGGDPEQERAQLIGAREALYAGLVDVETAARAAGASAAGDKRKLLVAKLEGVYRDLAALDERPAA